MQPAWDKVVAADTITAVASASLIFTVVSSPWRRPAAPSGRRFSSKSQRNTPPTPIKAVVPLGYPALLLARVVRGIHVGDPPGSGPVDLHDHFLAARQCVVPSSGLHDRDAPR